MKDLDKKSTDTARAAWLYYIEEFTQSQVADKLGVSRSTVIRLLQRARETGLVTISLGVSQETFELERDLERIFGLQTVRIVPEAEDGETQRRWLGQAAAGTLQEMARKDSILAVSWGRTLRAMADSLQGEVTVPGMKTVALIGGLHNADRGTNPYEVAEIVGQFFKAPARALYAPVYVRNAETAAGLISDTGLNEALDMARRASLVVFSVGSLSEKATMLQLGYVNATEKEFLMRSGAVGDIACRWIDANGAPVELPPTIHPIGISLNDIKRIPERLLVAGGASKAQAILASLKGGYATHLITDEAVAATLLAEARDHVDAN
ncbi:sugar-binding transcriptional regulator [Thetidibacter halocola]|uniref:Sugar-binding transcriptional regulator n=1 Tax=Thetidibacter halocola TaxID=2827239 RepID=A0A8J8B6R1_9RHOB|nr:sugar-binding transcriptional regulator [Thetidibacter halocola]MBS0122820.1 sugar-binding transcriptional regulator [Thetidibacter halocola]